MPDEKKKLSLHDYLLGFSGSPIHGADPDFNAMECSGGNFDDAYQMGWEDGERSLARYLLKEYDTSMI